MKRFKNYHKYQNAYNHYNDKSNETIKIIKHDKYRLKHSKKDKMKSKLHSTIRAKKHLLRKYITNRNRAERALNAVGKYRRKQKSKKVKRTKINAKKEKKWGNEALLTSNNASSEHDYQYFFTDDQAPSNSANIDQTPNDKGKSIVTNSSSNGESISIQGRIGGHTHSTPNSVYKEYKILKKWSDDHEDLYFWGHERLAHCQISEINPDWNETDSSSGTNILNFSMTLVKANYASDNVKSGSKFKNKGKRQIKKGSRRKKTRKRRIKKGDTYYKIAIKTGQSVQAIEDKNKYPANNLPVGKMMYY